MINKKKSLKKKKIPLFPSEVKSEEDKKFQNIKQIESIKQSNNNYLNNNIYITNNERNINNNKNNLNYNENVNTNNEYNNFNESTNTNIGDNENKEIYQIKNNLIIKKDIDYENTTIEKVFHITLDEENPKKYLYLEFYLAKILSLNQTPSFKLDNLDDIILNIMNEEAIKNNVLDYF